MLKKSAAPGDLAARLAKARDKRDRVVENAQANFAAQRRSVIEEGTTRVAQIVELQRELDEEKAAVEAVVNSA